MPKIIMVSTLGIWSMENGHGGPAFSRTIEKYLRENWDIFLISDEPKNKSCVMLDQEHNRIVKPTIFKKLGNTRIVGFLFRWLDHKLMTRKFCKEIKHIAEKDKKDTLLYAYEVFAVQACSLIAKKLELPIITRFQGTVLSQYKDNFLNRVRLYPHFEALSQKADLIIMTDDGTKGKMILDMLGNKSKLLFLKNGLDLLEEGVLEEKLKFNKDVLRTELGGNESIFLTVSRLVGWKKVERAIDGFAEYCKHDLNGRLVIVGDGDAKLELIKRTETYGISERVLFTGSVEHDKVYDYMMSCDVFISLYDISNVGNPLLEAMTLGKCIVTLDVGDTSSVIKDRENGILLTMDKLDSLGDILVELAHNPDLRQRLGNAAADFAKEHFWSWEDRMNTELFESARLLET